MQYEIICAHLMQTHKFLFVLITPNIYSHVKEISREN